jgi:iron complex outermembrane receptor protein
VLNASSAQVTGMELSTAWTPAFMEELTFQFAYTWLDPEYSDFVDQTTNLVKAAGAGACNPIQLPTGKWQCQIDLSGKQLEGVARNALFLSVDYLRPLADTQLDYFIHVDGNWQDKRYLDADNLVYLDDYWDTNASVGLQSEKWEIMFYVENLLNDDTIRAAGFGPDFGAQARDLGFAGGLGQQEVLATLPDERIIGLRASARFGK